MNTKIQKGTESWRKRAALFLVSQGVTLFGSSLVQFAIVWYVTMHTSSGAWVSALTVAAYLPQFIISFFSGVWADKYPKKTLIILSDSMIAAATLAFVLLMPSFGTEKMLFVSLVVISAIRSLGAGVQTPAVNAAITELVPEESLMKFNGMNATLQSFVQFAAPAAAGAILSFGTFRSTLLIDVITAFVGIGLLTAVAIPFNAPQKKPSVRSEMKAGIRYAIKERFIGQLLLIFGIFIFLCVPAGFLATLFVNRYYGDTYWYMTAVEVIGFIGMTAGGLLIGVFGGFRNHVKTLVFGIAGFGMLAVAMGIIQNFIVYLVLMAFYGIMLTIVQTASTTLLQVNTSPDMQGRVFGLFGAMYSGFMPLGMMVFGPLADVVSMRFLMVLSGSLLLVLTVMIVLCKSFYQHQKAE